MKKQRQIFGISITLSLHVSTQNNVSFKKLFLTWLPLYFSPLFYVCLAWAFCPLCTRNYTCRIVDILNGNFLMVLCTCANRSSITVILLWSLPRVFPRVVAHLSVTELMIARMWRWANGTRCTVSLTWRSRPRFLSASAQQLLTCHACTLMLHETNIALLTVTIEWPFECVFLRQIRQIFITVKTEYAF